MLRLRQRRSPHTRACVLPWKVLLPVPFMRSVADHAYVAERKYQAHMSKLERAETTINHHVGRKVGLSNKTMSSADKQFKCAR